MIFSMRLFNFMMFYRVYSIILINEYNLIDINKLIMSVFSKNLRYLRKKGNHNQDEIAQLFRISAQIPSETGKIRKASPVLQS